MVLLELAVQGIAGFRTNGVLKLQGGGLALRGPADAPPPVARLVRALVYTDCASDFAQLFAGAGGRGGLTLKADDGVVWRVLRERSGAHKLFKFNPASRQLELAGDASPEIERLLLADAGFPPRPLFDGVLSITAEALAPRAREGSAAAPVPAGPKVPSGAPDDVPPQLRGRIEPLEAELAEARRIEDTQYRLDGLQRDVDRLERALQEHEALLAERAELSAKRDSAPTVASIGAPEDIVARVVQATAQKRAFDDAHRKLLEEREAALGVGGGVWIVPPLTGDRRFWLSLGAAVALLVAAGLLTGGLRYLALLAVPAFSFAALLALRFVEELQAASRQAAKAEVFRVREEKLRAEFEASVATVQAAMDKVGAATSDEFIAALAVRDELGARLDAIERAVRAREGDGQLDARRAELAAQRGAAEALGQELSLASGSYLREAREIERELSALRAQVPPRPGAGRATSTEGDDFTPGLWAAAAGALGVEPGALWGALAPRVTEHLSALTMGRLTGLEVADGGESCVLAGEARHLVRALPSAERDAVALALRLTLAEASVARRPGPVLFDAAAGRSLGLDERGALLAMLAALGQKAQVWVLLGARDDGAGLGAMIDV